MPVDFSVATAALLPNARFERYPDAAHGVFITHSERVHADMLTFIQQTHLPSPGYGPSIEMRERCALDSSPSRPPAR
ncbi:MAG: hypothetical protein ABIQ16_13575 [Polyangiaceae bacterium]